MGRQGVLPPCSCKLISWLRSGFASSETFTSPENEILPLELVPCEMSADPRDPEKYELSLWHKWLYFHEM